MEKLIIGIDPGKGGGIAIISEDGEARAYKMPETASDLFDLLPTDTEFYPLLPVPIVYVEQVNAGPKMASRAAFKFGQCVGEIRMACIANGLRLEYVTPMKWQKAMGLLSKGRKLGEGDTAKKNRNKARAQELFPGIKVTHALADALLIAEYGRRLRSGELTPMSPASNQLEK